MKRTYRTMKWIKVRMATVPIYALYLMAWSAGLRSIREVSDSL
jgi:hypothetical protein